MNIKLLNDAAGTLPVQGTPFAIGHDLTNAGWARFKPGDTLLVPTHLRLAAPLPKGIGLFLLPRSSLFIKYGLVIPNSPGLIDPDYTGPFMIMLHRMASVPVRKDGTLPEVVEIPPGTRLAQLVALRTEEVTWEFVTESEFTAERGGFGSTG